MNIRSIKGALLAGWIPILFACITVNLYFPESTVKKTAEDIVNEVRGSDKTIKDEIKKDGMGQGEDFVPGPNLAAEQETEVTTPRIRALKESIKERFGKLVPSFDAARIGETNDGNLLVLNEDGLSLPDKSVLRKLVKDENQDRADLYAEVAKALDIDAGQIERIRKIFAEQWIGKAHPGWMVQKADGSWVKKVTE
jgi:uncharacterized protein YdbL (DUF1318 family)